MSSKKLTKKAGNPRKAGLKASAMGKVKALGISRNHNETLIREFHS